MHHHQSIKPHIHYGIAGFGRFGQRRLAPAFVELESSELTAIQKRNQTDAVKFAKKFKIKKSYSNYNDLIKDSEIQVIYIASPNGLHLEMAVQAAEAKKHILCEKPLATNADDCRKIIECCKTNKVMLMVGHNLRYTGVIQYLKKIINEEAIGEIQYVRIGFAYNSSESPRNWIYNFDLAGGGVLMDLGVHCIDTLRYLFGEVESIHSILKPSSVDKRIEEIAILNINFTSGVIGNVYCSYKTPYMNYLEIIGDSGRLFTEGFALANTDVKITRVTSDGKEEFLVPNANTYGQLITDFSHAILNAEPIPIPGIEGLKNQEIIDMAYALSKSG